MPAQVAAPVKRVGSNGGLRGFHQPPLLCRLDFPRPPLEKGGGNVLRGPVNVPGPAVAAQSRLVPLTQSKVELSGSNDRVTELLKQLVLSRTF